MLGVRGVSRVCNNNKYSYGNRSVRGYANGVESIGFIGLGNMGAPMANNILKAGHNLVCFDTNPDARTKLQGDFKVVSTPGEVAASVDRLVTMLPNSSIVKDVFGHSKDGIFANMRRGALLIDASTIDPLTTKQLAKDAQSRGATMLDAPVSGGTGGATAGTLTFMVGGSKEGFDRAHDLLSAMGKNIIHCGDNGNGQVVKLANNLALAIHMVGTCEAMNLGISLGMDPKLLAKIFTTASGNSWSNEKYNPVPGVMENVPASKGYNGGFAVDLMAKDVGLAVDAADSSKIPLLIGKRVQEVYRMLQDDGKGGKDFSYVYQYLQDIRNKEA